MIPGTYRLIAGAALSLMLFAGCSKQNAEPALEILTGMGGAETSEPLTADMILETVQEPALFYSVYQVQKGDMIGTIAERHGITQDTLISVNKIRQSRYIQIGQYLKIPSISGILYSTKKDGETPETIAQTYKISPDRIAAVNALQDVSELSAGTQLFLPDAQLDWVTRQEINGDLFRKPLRISYYQSSSFGWRDSPFTGKRTYHNGIDMASSYGNNVMAALSGSVVQAGYDPTYGKYVIISHHSGYKTLYGHMSAFVRNGKVYEGSDVPSISGWRVETGDIIGKVGSTGMSTGPHLHFTIFKNGTPINPVNLWN